MPSYLQHGTLGDICRLRSIKILQLVRVGLTTLEDVDIQNNFIEHKYWNDIFWICGKLLEMVKSKTSARKRYGQMRGSETPVTNSWQTGPKVNLPNNQSQPHHKGYHESGEANQS